MVNRKYIYCGKRTFNNTKLTNTLNKLTSTLPTMLSMAKGVKVACFVKES